MRNPVEDTVLRKYGEERPTQLSKALANFRKNNRKSDQYYLVLAQLLTPEERKAAAKESRKAWE